MCCGTKRLVEIACPADCGYLTSARVHPPAAVQRQRERDMQFLLPQIGDLTETQYRLLLLAQAITLQQRESVVPAPIDDDVAEAAATIAATLETAAKGIIYEHRAASLPAQRIADELGRTVADLRQRAGSEASRLERDLALALRRLEKLAREAKGVVPDPADPARSWLAIAGRLLGGTDAKSPGAPPPGEPAQDDKPRIVL